MYFWEPWYYLLNTFLVLLFSTYLENNCMHMTNRQFLTDTAISHKVFCFKLNTTSTFFTLFLRIQS